jgi:hypothetical protein
LIFPLRNQIFDCQNKKEGCATHDSKEHEGDNPLPPIKTIRAVRKKIQNA